MPRKERFWSKVEKTETCWNWTGCVLKSGHGQTWFNGKQIYAHRYFYELLVGKIPEGLVIDHLCENKRCVNPEHLEPVSDSENLIRWHRAHTRRPQYPQYSVEWAMQKHESCKLCRRIEGYGFCGHHYPRTTNEITL